MSVFIETSWGSLFKWGEELCGDKVELVKPKACCWCFPMDWAPA